MEMFALEGEIVGDVARCRAAQIGTVTAKVMFWARHPQSAMLDEMSLLVVPRKLAVRAHKETARQRLPALLPSIIIRPQPATI